MRRFCIGERHRNRFSAQTSSSPPCVRPGSYTNTQPGSISWKTHEKNAYAAHLSQSLITENYPGVRRKTKASARRIYAGGENNGNSRQDRKNEKRGEHNMEALLQNNEGTILTQPTWILTELTAIVACASTRVVQRPRHFREAGIRPSVHDINMTPGTGLMWVRPPATFSFSSQAPTPIKIQRHCTLNPFT